MNDDVSDRASPHTAHTITPHLVVRGAAQAAAWYQEAFGAQVGSKIPVPGGKSIQIELRLGDSRVMLADEFLDMGVTVAAWTRALTWSGRLMCSDASRWVVPMSPLPRAVAGYPQLGSPPLWTCGSGVGQLIGSRQATVTPARRRRVAAARRGRYRRRAVCSGGGLSWALTPASLRMGRSGRSGPGSVRRVGATVSDGDSGGDADSSDSGSDSGDDIDSADR